MSFSHLLGSGLRIKKRAILIRVYGKKDVDRTLITSFDGFIIPAYRSLVIRSYEDTLAVEFRQLLHRFDRTPSAAFFNKSIALSLFFGPNRSDIYSGPGSARSRGRPARPSSAKRAL